MINQKKKKVLIIRGPLGVGKTTISIMIAEKTGYKYISLDKIIDEYHLSTANGIPIENFLKANEIMFNLIDGLDQVVIIDGCFYYREQLDQIINRYDTTVFTLVSPIERCIERDSKRIKVYGEDAARYVYAVTTEIREGIEIDNTNLTVGDTAKAIMERYYENGSTQIKSPSIPRARAIIIKDGKILMIHRLRNGIEYYVLPGGKIEDGESPEVAVMRELKEETSIEAKLIKMLAVITDDRGQLHHLYLCEYISGTPKLRETSIEQEKTSSENIYEPMWLELDKIATISMWPAGSKPIIAGLSL